MREPNISMTQIVQATIRHFGKLSKKPQYSNMHSTSAVSPKLPIDFEDELGRALQHVISDGNPVLTLFFRRVCRVVMAGIFGGNYKDKLAGYSLSTSAQVIPFQLIIDLVLVEN